jgi:hypothetical protein
MKSLADIAYSYDNWATQSETYIEGIIFSIDIVDFESRQHHYARAARLAGEAMAFRARAEEIRSNRISQPLPLVDPPPVNARERLV